jgi:exopolysaccharide biosynthesis polyprenyl glycosylphosphotransferase
MLNKKNSLTGYKLVVLLLDICLMYIAFIITNDVKENVFNILSRLNEAYIWSVFIILIPGWLSFFVFLGLYKMRQNYFAITLKVGFSIGAGILLFSAFFYFQHDFGFSRGFLIVYSLLVFTLTLLLRFVVRTIFLIKKRNVLQAKKILVIGVNPIAYNFYKSVLSDPEALADIIGFVAIDRMVKDSRLNDKMILGDVEDLSCILKNHVVDEVVFALSREYLKDIEGYMLQCERMGLATSLVAHLFDSSHSEVKAYQMGGFPLISFVPKNQDALYCFTKRVLDILGATVGLIFTALAFVFIAPAIIIESKGPIFFSQTRVGLNGRTFKCYKFRSMYADAENRKKDLMCYNMMKGQMFKMTDDPRITKVGKFLRATSLDELPQFWNVLKGDMSLVGTRPPTLDEVEHYDYHHFVRLRTKPGITGLWQVSGRSTTTDFEEVVRLDKEYIEKCNMWFDIKILLKTLKVVILRVGAI